MKESRAELTELRDSAAQDSATITSLTAQNKLLQSKNETLQAEVRPCSLFYLPSAPFLTRILDHVTMHLMSKERLLQCCHVCKNAIDTMDRP